jgi:2,3-bisphosphoglycerate-independent phosphoglycerate mutase
MKYFILIPDGMADEAISVLNGLTPMEAADKPTTDLLAKRAEIGIVQNVPAGMVPESDTANMAIMSFDPKVYSKGRSPLEAVSMGIDMSDDDVAIRCNTVTLSDAERYEDRIMLDNSAGEISTEESAQLMDALNQHFANAERRFYTGVSYRHCLIWKNAYDKYDFARPHDIVGQPIGNYIPAGEYGEPFRKMMEESIRVLENHPVNIERVKKGLKPANAIWFWSPGKRPALPSFKEKFGLNAAVVSAVDLIKGIGYCAGMRVINVEGATGNLHTNYSGKAQAVINAFKSGDDWVYCHVEAPDECGHQRDPLGKVKSIENIDKMILNPVHEYLQSTNEDFGIMVLPDHPTFIRTGTHAPDPVPYMIYSSKLAKDGTSPFTEKNAAATGIYVADGSTLMQRFFDICNER